MLIERSSKSTFQWGKLRENIKSRHCFHQSEQRKKANNERDQADESSETTSSNLFKNFTEELEEFVENARKKKDQDDGSDRMNIEQSEASKSDDLFAVLTAQNIKNKASSAFKLPYNLKKLRSAVEGVAEELIIDSRETTPAEDEDEQIDR